MTFPIIRDKLLESILLLIGLSLIRLVIVLPFINSFSAILIGNIDTVSNALFALIMVWFARKMGTVAISIGILTVFLPVFGPIFYMLASLQNKNEDDKQELQPNK